MSKKRANMTDLLNDLTFRIIYDKLKSIAMTRFKWNGLSELNIAERHIERELFSNGICGFYDDPQFKYVALKCDPIGDMNVYGDSLRYNLTGHGYLKQVHRNNLVIIENNINKLSTEPFIMFYANKIYEAERTMDVNVKANKTPIILLCDDKDVLSFKRIFSMVDGNVPAIYADKSMNIDAIQALDMKTKFLCAELMDYKKSIENEVLTFLGVNNVPVEKRERLITDEAQSNNQLIDTFFNLQLEARERACEEINKKYGLSLSVKKRVDNVENLKEGEGDVRPMDSKTGNV